MDDDLTKMLDEGSDKNVKGNSAKLRQFYRLQPEIMFAKELPLNYVIGVHIYGEEDRKDNEKDEVSMDEDSPQSSKKQQEK